MGALDDGVRPPRGRLAACSSPGPNPIIVGQAAYNAAYGTNFVASGWCNSPDQPDRQVRRVRPDRRRIAADRPVQVRHPGRLRNCSIPFQPKGMHDEMNSANFDEWGRMTANLGLEAPGATPLLQNIILYPYVNPATEILDSTGLPSSLDVTPISSAADGTQIWKITHNGVDTHPIHFHLYDVQVINRVTWDNIIIPPDPTELGWKDTVRISPLEDTIVAVRPIVPTLPFAVPDSDRPLNPMMPIGAKGDLNGPNGLEAGFNNTDANGNPIAPIVNEVTDFGWEYVFHCHILSHEEMDMMRPVTVHVPSAAPDAPVLTLRPRQRHPHLDRRHAGRLRRPDHLGQPEERDRLPHRAGRHAGRRAVHADRRRALANTHHVHRQPAGPDHDVLYRLLGVNEASTSRPAAHRRTWSRCQACRPPRRG